MRNFAFLTIILLLVVSSTSNAQNYLEWQQHDVSRFYEKIDLDYNTLDDEGEEIDAIYVPTRIDAGLYEVEVYKVSYKLYQIRGTNIYMYFRYSPYLYNYDEGVLSVSYGSGTFYEKP